MARDSKESMMAQAILILFMLFGFFVMLSSPIAAQPRRALLIGNAAYATGPLRNPVNDATDMATMLRRLGFDVTLVRDADKPTLERAIGDFTRGVSPGSVGLFYFSGHGAQIDGLNYLLPVGAEFTQPTDVKYHAVAADWILGRMDDTGMEVKLLILDACRNNPFGRSWSKALDRGLAVMDAPKGSLIAYATSPKKTAADGVGDHSPYTARLLREISIPGRPIELVFKAVRLGVQQETQGEQTPWEASSLTGDFYFAPGEAPAVSTSPPSVTPLPPPTAPQLLPQPPVVAKLPESFPPTQPLLVLPAVQTVQDGPRGVENPFRLELGVPVNISLDKDEVTHFLIALLEGNFKVVLDTRRQFKGESSNLQSALSMTDEDGAVVKDRVIRFNEIDVSWRKTYNFSLEKPTKTGFRLINFHNKTDFWIVILPMPSPRATDNPQRDEAEIKQDAVKESDLKEYNPTMGELVPFPFFGNVMPKRLLLDQAQKGTLEKGESAYYLTILPKGKHKVVVSFDNTGRKNTNIQGYLAFLDTDGGGQTKIIRFNEIDVSARKSADITFKKASVVVMRIQDDHDTINYSVVIRPVE
jgi:hypothetical protein